MKAKKYIVALLLITTLVATVSCSSKETVNEVSNTKAPKAEIKIDVMRHENNLLAAIRIFNETHNNVSINYGDTISYDEDFRNKYITSLAVGEGPDIIRIDPYLDSGRVLLSAIYKTADSGVFYDLNKLIEKDESFKLSDYNQKAMESGIINGKRAFIPTTYTFRVFFAKDKVLRENNISMEETDWTLENFVNEACAFTENNEKIEKTGKYFAVAYGFKLSDVVKISGLDFIDYKKKEAKFNSNEFIDLINIYKKLSSVKTKSPDRYYYSEETFTGGVDCADFNNGNAIIMDNLVSPLWSRDRNNKQANIYLFPQYNNKKSILIEPKGSLAINSNSKYKNEAFEFIKLLISEEHQLNTSEFKQMYYLPVNINACLNNTNFYIANLKGYQPDTNEYDYEKRKEQVKAQYKEIESISRCDTVDAQIYDIIDSEAQSFINGKRTAEQTAEIIQNKVMLYLNE